MQVRPAAVSLAAALLLPIGLGCTTAGQGLQASPPGAAAAPQSATVDDDPRILADLFLATTSHLPGQRARPIVVPVAIGDAARPEAPSPAHDEPQRADGRANRSELRARCTAADQMEAEFVGEAPSVFWLDGVARREAKGIASGTVPWRWERLYRLGDTVIVDAAAGSVDASPCRSGETENASAPTTDDAPVRGVPRSRVTHRARFRAYPLLPGGLGYAYRYESRELEGADLLVVLLPRVSQRVALSSWSGEHVTIATGGYSRVLVRLGSGHDVSWLARIDFADLQEWLRALGTDEARRTLPSSGGSWTGSFDLGLEIAQTSADTSPIAVATLARAPWVPQTRQPSSETVTRPGVLLR